MASVTLVDLHVTRGDDHVVRGIDLAVPEGTWVALLGASGSGKTTVLRAIAGVQAVSHGRVLLDDDDVTHWPPGRRGVGMVPQGARMLDHLDVAGNVAFPLKLRGLERRETRRRVRTELRVFGLGRFALRRPGTLSAGERQRAATAHATVGVPRALLLDEPVANLDAARRGGVLQNLRTMLQASSTTCIMSTNDPSVAAWADAVAVLVHGRVAQVAPMADLYAGPHTLDVADLTGTWPVNRLAARVEVREGRRTLLHTTAGTLGVWHRGLGHLRQVLVAVRPSDLHVVTSGQSGAGSGLRGTVDQVSMLGATWEVRLHAGGHEVVAVATTQPPPRGQTVGLSPRRVHIHGLDGRRLGGVDLDR